MVRRAHNSHVSRWSSGFRHASTDHASDALKWRSCGKRAACVLKRQLAPSSDTWMCRVCFMCVDPCCADGFQPRFRWLSSGTPIDTSMQASTSAYTAFCAWHSSSTVGPAETDDGASPSCDAYGQLFNNRVAIGQECTQLLRCRHLHPKYLRRAHMSLTLPLLP